MCALRIAMASIRRTAVTSLAFAVPEFEVLA